MTAVGESGLYVIRINQVVENKGKFRSGGGGGEEGMRGWRDGGETEDIGKGSIDMYGAEKWKIRWASLQLFDNLVVCKRVLLQNN